MPDATKTPDPGPPELPSRLFRVEWWEGLDRAPTDRHHTARNFTTAAAAGRQVAYIDEWPEHHVLIGVYVCDPAWREIDASSLPRPSSEGGTGE